MASQAISFDAPLKQATTIPASGAPAGVTFDSPLTSDTTLPTQGASTIAPAPQSSDELSSNPSDSLLTTGAKAVGGTFEGIGEGAFGTMAGASDLADKITGMQPGAVSNELHTLAGDNNQSHGIVQSIGRGGEGLAEFLLGDAALKALPMSVRLAKVSKTLATVEDSPLLARIFDAGVRAVRGGIVGTTQGALKTGGNPTDAIGEGAAAAIGNAVVPEGVDAVKAARTALPGAIDTLKAAIKPGIIQDAFQSQIRDVINSAAKDAGVDVSNAPSIRDVGQQVSDNLLQKARQSYQMLDEITGGRAQRFRDAVSTVERKLSNLSGISSPDDEGKWIERLNDLTDAHDQAMSEATDALKTMGKGDSAEGVLNQADRDFRTHKSMLDLNKAIRLSTEGLRPELASGAKSPIAETVNTSKLFPRVQKLYDSGRLQHALGDRAGELVQAVNDSHAASQLAQSWRNAGKALGKYAGLPFGAYEAIHHLFGGSE